MKTIEKIRAEIERRIKLYSVTNENEQWIVNTYWSVLSFLSTLESETTYDTQQYTPRPSVDIEDVARVQFASHAKVFDKKRKAVFDWEQFKEVAGIFYGFGKKDRSDTLESEKPMNLEEEVKRYYSDNFDYISSDQPTLSILTNIARHFAQWGAEHTPLPEDTVLFNKGVEEGKRLMMEEAVEGKVCGINGNWVESEYLKNPVGEEGDKVKLIIIKED